jgi:phosphoribosyl 1,2-cyclic phosphate phosphodiesterase
MKVTVLGSGTSSGVPTVGCTCTTCLSDDPQDKRLRPSLLIQSETTTVVIDTSSDFRQQMLQYHVRSLDAVVYTHHHFDHIGGFDDIRAFNFIQGRPLDIFLMDETLEELRRTFLYAFEPPRQIGGGIPLIDVHVVDEAAFTIGDLTFTPIPLCHGLLRVNGYRINNFAYCTDTNFIPDSSMSLLEGLDVLILDALRPQKHPTHFTVEEAVDVARKIGAKKTYFTHISHALRHCELAQCLPEGIAPGYDGLVVEI